ncbi:NADH-quinone oxidoreductase subunit L [Polymorphobacter fuscus]|uniref:NADH-quinone oxidoreductase subunit L n=1 Tax=Sandarakinorhabdus fusca TaxID=1439888 RepID=A0A7C9KK01_9SPHN|nr:NADH-quinone oxidoreductase subunit L [Polymorphobacter fuscus]MQT18680.1 NADH-quinone oxidoreductase subunit L [Polymorphobacter fuscus]
MFHLLLFVPAPALAAFLVLGLAPVYLSRRFVMVVAVIGGVLPLLLMAGMASLCLSGQCQGVAPIFDLMVGPAHVDLALLLDPLSTVVGMTVTQIGACVMVYSVDYMAGAKTSDLRRFFALMNLFLAAMLTMVLAGDSILYFLGWELMGMCSFFLIAYNIGSSRAIAAGRKAFIMSRIADALLLAGLLLLFIAAGSVRIEALIPAGLALPPQQRTIIAAMLLGGALGKSAQLPFHTWLPSAMAGPTPVSALLHSATMVAAGAYLMARFAPLLAEAPGVMMAMAIGGAATALFGAFTALFQNDVKRLLAFSSISQIGFMLLALGVGSPAAAMAHFVIHALFKSLLFLSAGDMAHSAGDDTSIAAMRGAAKRRPLAFATFAAGAASLSGLPLVTAGWWSKEEILDAALASDPLGPLLWGAALLSAVLTATYAFRPVLAALQPGAVEAHPHPTGPATAVPLVLLAIGAITGGLLVGPIIHLLGGVHPEMPAFTMLIAAAAPLTGLAFSVAITRIPALAQRVATARHLRQGLRIDVRYHVWFVQPFQRLVQRLSGARGHRPDPFGALPVRLVLWLKRQAIDRFTRDGFDRLWMGLAATAPPLWAAARRSQTGRVRHSVMAMTAGAAALLVLALMTTRPTMGMTTWP